MLFLQKEFLSVMHVIKINIEWERGLKKKRRQGQAFGRSCCRSTDDDDDDDDDNLSVLKSCSYIILYCITQNPWNFRHSNESIESISLFLTFSNFLFSLSLLCSFPVLFFFSCIATLFKIYKVLGLFFKLKGCLLNRFAPLFEKVVTV